MRTAVRLPWKAAVREAWRRADIDDVFGRAAQMAYFFLLSAFPLLILVGPLLGLVGAGGEVEQQVLRYLQTIMPASALQLMRSTLVEIRSGDGGGRLSLGVLVTLWAASAGMTDVIEGLNKAYQVKEARPWWKRRLLGIALTVVVGLLTIAALAILFYGSRFGRAWAGYLGLGPAFAGVWSVLQWPAMALFVLAGFALVYRFAPNVHEQKLHWILPGSAVAFALWLAGSLGLRLYLGRFNSYSMLYGSLGAVVILMLWLYLFGAAILIGGEVNSAIEHTAARAGDPEAKLPGEKSPAAAEAAGPPDISGSAAS